MVVVVGPMVVGVEPVDIEWVVKDGHEKVNTELISINIVIV